MRLGANGKRIIKSFESCRLKAYPDPKTGGAPWTVGWGSTGPDVHAGMTITFEEADRRFDAYIAQLERDVSSLITVPVTQDQFDALCSFAYNCGTDIDADTIAEGLGDSTLLKKLNAGDYLGAADEFLKWISKGSAAENGLRRRRKAERLLFLGDPSWASFL